MVKKTMNICEKTLWKARTKIIPENMKLREKTIRLNKPIDHIKTQLWENQHTLNRIDREIAECWQT